MGPSVEEQNKPVIRVAIADKSPLVQAALKHLMSEDDRFSLVVVCSDGERLMEAFAKLDFDVAIVGWVMPRGNGKYILDQVQTYPDAPRIVIYTGAEGNSIAAQVMAHGGAAYVSKSDPPEELLDAVAAVAAGRMVFPYMDVRKIHDTPIASLTKRELEVLSSMSMGRTNNEIASEQDVSPNTVKFHIKNIYEKLSVRNRAEAVALYIKS